MIAVAFKFDPSHPVMAIFNILAFWSFVLLVIYFVLRILLGRRSFGAKSQEEQLQELRREWCQNGTAIANWLRIHLIPGLSLEVIISKPELQDMLRKDFEIYNKLVLLDPKLKEDPVFNQGRDFYGSLIRTKNST